MCNGWKLDEDESRLGDGGIGDVDRHGQWYSTVGAIKAHRKFKVIDNANHLNLNNIFLFRTARPCSLLFSNFEDLLKKSLFICTVHLVGRSIKNKRGLGKVRGTTSGNIDIPSVRQYIVLFISSFYCLTFESQNTIG